MAEYSDTNYYEVQIDDIAAGGGYGDMQDYLNDMAALANETFSNAERAEAAAEDAEASKDFLEDLKNGIEPAVDAWLDEHPEATTTVQDNSLTTPKYRNESITMAKIADDIKQAIARFYVTPEMFGAVGDGLADDTDAIRAAFSSNLPVLFYNGKTYRISNWIQVRQGATIDLNGSTIVAVAGSPNANITNVRTEIPLLEYNGIGNFTIKNGTIIGCEMLFAHGENITIENVHFRNSLGGHHIQIMSCRNVVINRCSFIGLSQSSTAEAVNLDLCYEGHFNVLSIHPEAYDDTNNENITISNCYFDIGSDDFAYMNDALCAHSHADSVNSDGHLYHKNVRILNNVIKGATDCSIRIQDCRDSIVCGNYVECTIAPLKMGYGMRNIITGNKFMRDRAGNAFLATLVANEEKLSLYDNYTFGFDPYDFVSTNAYSVTFAKNDEVLLRDGEGEPDAPVTLKRPATLFNELRIGVGALGAGDFVEYVIKGYKRASLASNANYPLLGADEVYATISNDGNSISFTGLTKNIRYIFGVNNSDRSVKY